MGNFDRNRGSRSGGGRGFSSKGGPSFGWNDRGSRGPAEIHQAVCDNCGKSCEVPFRPTSGKPIYCSSCFGHNKSSDSKNFSAKEMFEAVCDECGNKCQVPFQPSSGKPIYCSNCFGEKKGAGDKGNEQFEVLNNKLDKILSMLMPKVVEKKTKVVKEKPSKPLAI